MSDDLNLNADAAQNALPDEAPAARALPRPARRRGDSCAYALLYLSFFLFSLAGWLRLGRTIADWYWLTYAEVYPGPWYLALTGAVWGALGLAAVLVLYFRYRWGRLLALAAALLMALMYWLDRLLVSQAPLAGSGAVFAALATLLLLAMAAALLRPWPELRMLASQLDRIRA
jgi:hypothetical protein